MNPKQKYIAFKTIVRKEIVRFMRIWSQTLLPAAVTQTLYFVIFGKFVGARIGAVQGIDYMAFIVPGLVMMAVINNSFGNVVSSFFGSKFQRNVEELLVSPTPNWIILAGYIGGGLMRGLCVGVIVFCLSVFFTAPHISHVFIIILFVVMTAIVFSLGGFLNGMYAKKFDDVSIFPTFILTPLTYLGGVFYSVRSLPQTWQNISHLNPILYMVDGFRFGFYGVSDVNVGVSISILLALIAVLTFLNLYLLKKGIGLKV